MSDNRIICQGCLSTERKLYSLSELQYVIDAIHLPEITTSGGVCFECRTAIMKYYSFRMNVFEAQDTLLSLEKLTNLKCLSSLSILPPKIYYFQPLCNNDNVEIEQIPHFQSVFTDECPEAEIRIKKEIDDTSNFEEANLDDNTKQFDNDKEKQVVKFNDESILKIEDTHCQSQTTGDIIDKFEDSGQTINDIIDEIEDRWQTTDDIADQFEDSGQTTNDITDKIKDKYKSCQNYKVNKLKGDTEIKNKIISVMLTYKEVLEFRNRQKKRLGSKRSPFKCETCLIAFLKSKKLEEHMQMNHNQACNAYVCDICQTRFFDEKAGIKHRRTHFFVHKCKFCDYESNELWVTWGHCKVKHKKETADLDCTQCHLVFRTFDEKKEHLKNVHSAQCDICGEKFKAKNTMLRHVRVLHGYQRELICDICQRTFKTKTRLESHIVRHNSVLAKKLSYCALCKTQYKNIYVYRNHLKNSVHHVQETVQCTDCDSKFASKAYWKKHYNFYHLKKSRYKCEDCDVLFISEYRLKCHRQLYHGMSRTRNHSCNICGKKFFTLATLNGHKRTHSEERAFMCEDCGDTFKQRPALYTHTKLVHKGIKRSNKQKKTIETN